jgi:hypothetical protein
MEWADYRAALVRGLWLLGALAVVGAGVGYALPKTVVHPNWITTTTVGAPPSVTGVGSPIPPGVSTDQIQYYAASDGVFSKAGTLADIDEPVGVLRSWVSITGPCGANCSAGSNGTLTGTVEVRVEAPSSAESASFNTAFDEALQEAVNDSATTLNNGQAVNTGFQVLQTTEAAFAVPTKTAVQTLASRPLRVLIGALLGLVLALLIVLVRALTDKRVNTIRRAEGAVGYPVVAQMSASESDSGDPGEAYRMLWLSIFVDPLPQPLERGRDEWLDEADLRADPASWKELES